MESSLRRQSNRTSAKWASVGLVLALCTTDDEHLLRSITPGVLPRCGVKTNGPIFFLAHIFHIGPLQVEVNPLNLHRARPV
jgi:hypothetical protein